MCAVILGPAEDLGHPFPGQGHEIPRRRVIGDSIVYSFGRPFLHEPISIEPEEPITAVALWDPCWMRLDPDASDEWERIEALAAEHRAPIVGLLGDWYAGWRGGISRAFNVPNLLPRLAGVVTDAAGAISVLSTGYGGAVVASPHMLTYGRLPTLGADPAAVANAATERRREIDVCCIAFPHASVVWQRPFYLDLVRRVCAERGWTCVIQDGVSPAEMEALYLRSRVVFNCSLGSQLNCRVYEALACGCHLLTDGWNLENPNLPSGVAFYNQPDEVERGLRRLLEQPPDATVYVPWVLAHGPVETWKRNLAAIRMAATPDGFSRRARGATTGLSYCRPKRIAPSAPLVA